ncbi:MAG: flagellar protein FliT [Methylobacter sp.]|nr:flagellar protein FliT [Methylobacter sp.]
MSAVPELVQQLEGFVELIAAAIESRDWDDLNDLLVNRQETLERLCALSLSPLERKAVVNMMASMQATDRQLLALVQSQKEVLQKQAASLAHDRKAIRAYQAE